MRNSMRVLIPLAAAAVPLALVTAPAMAAHGDTYQTTLNPLNNQKGSGSAWVTLNGNQATVKMNWSGLASTFNGGPFPHVQHIHIGAKGECPTMAQDKNGDGLISTSEAAGEYGGIGATLSVKGDTSPKAAVDIKIAPGGSSLNYKRTFTVSSDVVSSIKQGTGVIVVHGDDPTLISKKAQGEKSDLVPSLPLAATSPALCGALSAMPSGGVATGSGSTSGIEDLGMFAVGGGLLAAGGAAFALRRRETAKI